MMRGKEGHWSVYCGRSLDQLELCGDSPGLMTQGTEVDWSGWCGWSVERQEVGVPVSNQLSKKVVNIFNGAKKKTSKTVFGFFSSLQRVQNT